MPEQPGDRRRPGEPRVDHHDDQLVGRDAPPAARSPARHELDGRHPAVHRRHPRDRQQRRLQRLRAHRRGRARLVDQGHHLDRAVQQRDPDTPQSPVTCPPTFKVQGITYHNDQNESEPAGTPFITDFAQSCNNAFDQFYGRPVRQAGVDREGLLRPRPEVGHRPRRQLSASYMNVPASASGAELAQETWGEGALTASPLAMASVAATVENGSFKQPILTAGTKQATASAAARGHRHRPQGDDAGRGHRGARRPTSASARTSTPRPGRPTSCSQGQPNSWLIAFDPTKDVAVAPSCSTPATAPSSRAPRSSPSSTPTPASGDGQPG